MEHSAVVELEGQLSQIPVAESESSAVALYRLLSLPLDDPSIRLLDLDPLPDMRPDRGRTGDPLELTGTLRVIPLRASPTFSALSYVWGEFSTPPKVLACNGAARLAISDNCYDALCALRRRHSPITVWVDAVCINQADLREREAQIPLMGQIYQWALPVYIWLGPGNNLSDSVFDGLAAASAACRYLFMDGISIVSNPHTARQRGGAWSPVTQFRVMAWLLRRAFTPTYLGLRHARLPRARELDDIFQRPWFERAWTFQEFVLASDMVFLCGSKSINWDTFARGLTFLVSKKAFASAGIHHRVRYTHSLVGLWGAIPRPLMWNGIERRVALNPETTMRNYLDKFDQSLQRRAYLFLPLILWRIVVYRPTVIWPLAIALSLGFYATSDCFRPTAKDHGLSCYRQAPLFKAIVALGAIYVLAITLQTITMYKNKILHPEAGSDLEIEMDGILRAIQYRHATDAKDKSYATYGVLQSLIPQPLSTLNYDKPLGVVYRELLADLMTWKPGFIRLVSGAGIHPIPDTPSWVPNWSATPSSQWLERLTEQDAGRSAGTMLDPRIEADTLHIPGYLLGSVSFSSGPFTSLEALRPDAFSLTFCAEELCHIDKPDATLVGRAPRTGMGNVVDLQGAGTDGRNESLSNHSHDNNSASRYFDAVSRLAVWMQFADQRHRNRSSSFFSVLQSRKYDGETHPEGTKSRHATLQKLENSQRHIIDLFDDLWWIGFRQPHAAWGDWNDGRYDGDFVARMGPILEPVARKSHAELKTCADALAGTRCLFTLEDGLPGSGPETTLRGDVVAILSGVPAPMILRPSTAGTYQVVGAAFLDFEPEKQPNWTLVSLV